MRKYEVAINGKNYVVVVKSFNQNNAVLDINGKSYIVNLDSSIQTFASGTTSAMSRSQSVAVMPPLQAAVPSPQPVTPVAAPPAPVTQTPAAAQSSSMAVETVTAPIPGSILELLVKKGDRVTEGQTLLKMEAMKMENEINATVAGTVQAIKVNIGDAVNQGQALVEISP